MRRITLLAFVVVATVLGACGDDAATTPFTLQIAPAFVQGAVPGATTGVIVTITNDSATDEPVTITAAAPGALVTVVPGEIRDNEVAEIWVIPDPATEERELEITVTGTRGEIVVTATKAAVVMPWDDDRGDEADDLLAVFVGWLDANRPDLGIGPDTGFTGSLSAPGLLVVSHYLYLSDEWELGLAWHVMIPPDDWADIYLRPRAAAAPTLAFRLASQAAARQGTVEITEVTPPAEIVR